MKRPWWSRWDGVPPSWQRTPLLLRLSPIAGLWRRSPLTVSLLIGGGWGLVVWGGTGLSNDDGHTLLGAIVFVAAGLLFITPAYYYRGKAST